MFVAKISSPYIGEHRFISWYVTEYLVITKSLKRAIGIIKKKLIKKPDVKKALLKQNGIKKNEYFRVVIYEIPRTKIIPLWSTFGNKCSEFKF